MKTKIIKINPEKLEISKVKIAAETLRKGGLVAFPTETVYGLGADALNSEAIKKIFEAKGRPIDNPLIVHIADKKEVYRLAREVPREAEKLINKFWPGPLTIILKKSNIVSDIITAGLDSVAIRMPNNKIALTLIKKSKVPIVAPSANLSGKPSPTMAEHVIQDLYGKIEIIIDGGETDIGVESTVLDLTTNPPTLLRPGGVDLEKLKKVLGKIKIYPMVKGKQIKKIAVKSPGMKYRHYAPNAKVILVEGKYERVKNKIQELTDKYKKKGKKIAIMTTNKNYNYKTGVIKFIGKDCDVIAKNLFKTFREFDKEKVDLIIAEGVSDNGLGLAVMNRLRKASYKIICI
ncbi:MAG: L-threonylcarbamoyladenylate synthase [Nanoarchaeota archaeon]|nr:threonylcarbamoyl-AMP synthase [Nanoarchaeota archaeon]MBU1444996.1 threonylcarbamoyl-AMP synthase [Nanoarchaeota archaeon]MBU2420706.1 threonylcarbamoyl-AMP synthase [Nanoarchaeota archaeon]MBU2475536.1 threonylcarbamoyl-AMP synthase [Nanoarchaeota archaeon]